MDDPTSLIPVPIPVASVAVPAVWLPSNTTACSGLPVSWH